MLSDFVPDEDTGGPQIVWIQTVWFHYIARLTFWSQNIRFQSEI